MRQSRRWRRAAHGALASGITGPSGCASPSVAAIESAHRALASTGRSIAILARGAARTIFSMGASHPPASVGIERIERLGPAQEIHGLPHRRLQHAASERLLALPAAMRRLPAAVQLSDDDAVMLARRYEGDRTYLTHTLRVGFERTGSFHMLVVSGFHLAILAGCIFWIARRLRLACTGDLLTIAGFVRVCTVRACDAGQRLAGW